MMRSTYVHGVIAILPDAPVVPRYAVRIGRKAWAVGSLGEVRPVWEAMRDALELAGEGGASRMPRVTVVDLASGRTVARVSYNGRLWHPVTDAPMNGEGD